MRLDEYQQLAIRTMADSQPHDHNKLVCALGLAGEAIEWYTESQVLGVDRLDEAGDIMWYVAVTAYLHGWNWEGLTYADLPDGSEAWWEGVLCRAGEVAEQIKKEVGHGHAHDAARLRNRLGMLISNLADICEGVADPVGFGEAVLAPNIAKLQRRYPNGFSSEASIARVDVARPTAAPGGSGAG
jgi:NTP pyrophosphatase (non-canonical NTP hydrolase)